MNVFIVEYESEGNLFKGFLVVKAESPSDAQTKFLNWLQNQDTYKHLWNLKFRVIGSDHKPFKVIE